MPAASSIYWNSVDSQRSSGASSGSSRHYVDPWDLENYAYLRRCSVATPTHRPQQGAGSNSYSTNVRPPEPEYWYAPRIREPGYDAPASVEELYFGPPKQVHHSQTCYYHQPIYEDEVVHYAAPVPIYAPLSDLEHGEAVEDHRSMEMVKRRGKLAQTKSHQREECLYHGLSSTSMQNSIQEVPSIMTKEVTRYVEVAPPSNLGLNTYGHLKIDYTNSWNSLHRKIRK